MAMLFKGKLKTFETKRLLKRKKGANKDYWGKESNQEHLKIFRKSLRNQCEGSAQAQKGIPRTELVKQQEKELNLKR